MDRYAVYPDISPGYVVLDTLSETVVALYHDRRDAERAARRLNEPRRPPSHETEAQPR